MPYLTRHQHSILVLTGLLLLALSIDSAAADTPLVAAAAVTPKRTAPLDLSAPPITEVLSAEQIDEVLSRTVEPRSIEEIEVDRGRLTDPFAAEYIPPGFAALFWAAGRPSGLWRLFSPALVQKARTIVDPTNPTRPAPGIPAMAGEATPYDR